MCKTREFPLAGEQNATLSSLIKGRYAAFFLSLQCINILTKMRITGILLSPLHIPLHRPAF
ncbi:hypothetical protein FDX01_17285 [Citrobacter sp. wls613]|uniref:Uncharacterized protein n=1 Tax=Citrobacter gillenii TaxID=67828 RepID=A0ABD6MG54_9ENTR|nr:hypothetical protein CO701_00605 [Citrobacter werkmanii]NTZ51866.1 hypothetical protein [Citrobacter gillenii]QCA16821.1 hypothetical protein E5284_02585 [Citrobacter freundii]TKU05756.1 hypothetical protein FDW88_21970 [Citrobacter sp. wls829]TKU36640.1 hypothetical protein FDW95_02545 [Citrobacter sp. wls718]TKU56191.1 hypothetical protein FDW98_19395 [Citrobacter sp. wls711]TKU77767.1 hypothetical protein FDX22_25225 [Citrobacter sp. TBCS-14]TKV18918.1 hypothetical protein FDX01_17285 